MSEDKKGFWNNLPAILGGFSGLIMAIVALITVLKDPGSSLKPEATPQFQSSVANVPATVVSLKPEIILNAASPSHPVDSIPVTRLQIIHQGEQYWAKSGHFLKVNNELRIWPSGITDKSAFVKITDDQNNIVIEKTIQISEAIKFNYQGKNFEIGLDKTGNAGKNPFTKAAFFIVRMA